MNVIAVSGSPRKNWNTEKMLASALEGAQSQRLQKLSGLQKNQRTTQMFCQR